MNRKYITVISLIIGQGLTGSIISLLTLTSTLVGNKLAPNNYLITLPITATVIGASMMVYYASLLMNTYGRRKAFLVGSFIGIIGTIMAIVSLYYELFSLFVISTFILGAATVFNQYYRFTGAEVFDDEISKKKCSSLIIGGGIIGGIIGPLIAAKGAYLIPEFPFIGTFLIAGLVFILASISQLFINIPNVTKNTFSNKEDSMLQNEIKKILHSPQFIIGTLSCAIGFSLMTIVMNATPLEMHHSNYSIGDSAFVLQLHFIAMYAPALFLPLLISKLKTLYIIQGGALCFVIGSIISFCFNGDIGYMITLVLVGIGWSFMFTGGTFLINELDNPSIKHKIQGINSTTTYIFNLIASFSVGIFMSLSVGWIIINSIVIIIILFFLLYIYKNHLNSKDNHS